MVGREEIINEDNMYYLNALLSNMQEGTYKKTAMQKTYFFTDTICFEQSLAVIDFSILTKRVIGNVAPGGL